MLYSVDTPAPEESPATATKKKSESIETAIVILGIHSYLIVKEHPDKVEWGYKTMPQPSKESVFMSGQTLINNFIICTTGQ